MKYDNIKDIVGSKNIVIPLYIYKNVSKFDVDTDAFILLMYLNGLGDMKSFDVVGISKDLSWDIKTVMERISILQSKKLIEIKVVNDDKGVMREYISLDLFYDKLSMNMIGDINEKRMDVSSIFNILENELNKQLTPIETEIVRAWKEHGYSDEIIKEAIKEAVYNGAANLRYIDKILYEWSTKNIKTKEDVEKNKKNFREKKNEGKIQKIELFDYDWIEDSSNGS